MKAPLGRDRREGGRHGLVPMLLGCGLLLGLLLVLTWADAAWSGPLVLAALVVCLGAMVVMGSTTGRLPGQRRSGRHESDH